MFKRITNTRAINSIMNISKTKIKVSITNIMKMSKTNLVMIIKMIQHLIIWAKLMRFIINMKAIMKILLKKQNKITLVCLMIHIKNSFKLALLSTMSLSMENLKSFSKIKNSDRIIIICLNTIIGKIYYIFFKYSAIFFK